MIENENKELTFHPSISYRSKKLSSDQKIEDRLIKDVHQRHLRQIYREELYAKKLKDSQCLKPTHKSRNFSYRIFERDFHRALESIHKTYNDVFNFTDLCGFLIELQMIDLKLMKTKK